MGNFQSCTKIIESKPNYTKEEIKQKELLCIKSECKIPGELNDWSMFYLHKHMPASMVFIIKTILICGVFGLQLILK